MDRKLTLAVLTGGSNNMFDFLLPASFDEACNVVVGAMSHGGLISTSPIGKDDRKLLKKLVDTKTIYENSKWDQSIGSYLLVLHTCVFAVAKDEEHIGISGLILYRVDLDLIAAPGIFKTFLSKVKTLDQKDIFNEKKLAAFLDQSDC